MPDRKKYTITLVQTIERSEKVEAYSNEEAVEKAEKLAYEHTGRYHNADGIHIWDDECDDYVHVASTFVDWSEGY